VSSREVTGRGLRGWSALALAAALVVAVLLLVLPLGVVFTEALRGGVSAALDAFDDPDAMAAIRLTLLVAAITVCTNTVFGIAAAWLLTKHDFRFRQLLVTLIELPLSVSPVIQAWFGCCCSACRAGSDRPCGPPGGRSSSRPRASCWRPCS